MKRQQTKHTNEQKKMQEEKNEKKDGERMVHTNQQWRTNQQRVIIKKGYINLIININTIVECPLTAI